MSTNFLSGTPADLQRALADESRHMQEQETASKAKSLNLPYVNLQNFPLDLNVLSFFTEQEARESQSVPFYKDGKVLRIGSVNPKNPLLLQKIAELSKKYQSSIYLISEAGLNQTIKFYNKVLIPKSTFQDSIQLQDGVDYATELKNLPAEYELAPQSPLKTLTTCFGAALTYGASDIHIEPEEGFVKVRFRIDGVLQDLLHIPKPAQKALIARIKSLSKLKLNVDNVPQDGRLGVYQGSKAIDVRVSTLPTAYGEGTVLRLLGTGAGNLKIKDLGLTGRALAVVERGIAQPNGMIITTGPTGSGKSTTLYAFLNELNEPGVKIITLEDPIEYKLPGVQQTPIDHSVDFSFAKGLKAILRQDPDIVMVGEIRDTETAETALQASLTGHIVLSTLHTNDAPGAVPRLIVMGAKPFVIAPALTVVIAQRLVRKLCTSCIKPVTLAPELLKKAHEFIDQIPKNAEVDIPKKIEFAHATGCNVCHGLGYKGRVGIFEVIDINDSMKELILNNASAVQIKKQAVSDGMVSMVQDGLLKALSGITDIEEVFRVAGT